MRNLFLSGVLLLSAAMSATPAFGAEAAESLVANRDAAANDRALHCLTQAVYYEARSESEDGQRAVAQVVLNRVRHPSYPNSVCGVVYQGSERATGCQFTFTCDGSLSAAIEPYAWERASRIAASALRGNVYRPVGLALNYHTTAISPYWAPSLVPQAVVGAHIFYRRPGSGGMPDAFSQAPAEDEPDAPSLYARPQLHARQRARPARLRYAAMPLVEIPVVERPVLFRTIGGARPAAASGTSRQSSRRAVAAGAGPRVMMQGGVRISRGGAAGAAN